MALDIWYSAPNNLHKFNCSTVNEALKYVSNYGNFNVDQIEVVVEVIERIFSKYDDLCLGDFTLIIFPRSYGRSRFQFEVHFENDNGSPEKVSILDCTKVHYNNKATEINKFFETVDRLCS